MAKGIATKRIATTICTTGNASTRRQNAAAVLRTSDWLFIFLAASSSISVVLLCTGMHTAWCLACEERRDYRVKAPRPWPRKHHDGQPDAVQRFGDVEQVTEPIGAINWLPGTYPFDGVKYKGSGTNHEQPERRQHGQ